jgi:protein-S-isoprenylcysteine O-methyltransferase Ste14
MTPISRGTYDALAYGVIAAGVATFVALLFVVAPYGRHTRGGWGPTIPERIGWMVMESPSLVLFSAIFFAGPRHAGTVPLLLWAMWALHYANRTIVHPLRIKSTRRMPIAIVAMAIVFNVTNATMNASFIGGLGEYASDATSQPRFIAGVVLFACGMVVNLDADRRLFALRTTHDGGYSIPRGGLYELVSCPNYLGEIVEWIGWAIASWSLGGLAFALFTIANLAPRALSNHAWYKRTFPDYPRARRALVPFVL